MLVLDGTVLAFTAGDHHAYQCCFWSGAGIAGFQSESYGIYEGRAEYNRRSAHQRLRGALVVAETALGLMLLVMAGLLLRSFHRILSVDPGMNPQAC